jgi:hypothetical protein
MEAGFSLYGFAFLGQVQAAFADDNFEVFDIWDVLVDDRFVDESQAFRQAAVRANRAAGTLGAGLRNLKAVSVCQPALSSARIMMRSSPAPVSLAKSASSASKNGLETPLCTYQKISPVAGETKAVT